MIIEIQGKRYELSVKKLSPREMLRLQGVPDWAIARMLSTDDQGKQIISNSQIQKMAGNSLVPACVTAIMEKLLFPTQQ